MSGTVHYCGGFRDNRPYGTGMESLFQTVEGSEQLFQFQGDFNGNQIQNGSVLFPDGEKYEGPLENHQMHGWGKLFDSSQRIFESGRYENDQFKQPKAQHDVEIDEANKNAIAEKSLQMK